MNKFVKSIGQQSWDLRFFKLIYRAENWEFNDKESENFCRVQLPLNLKPRSHFTDHGRPGTRLATILEKKKP